MDVLMNLVRFVKCHSPAELPNTPPLPLLDYNDEVTEKLGESESFFFYTIVCLTWIFSQGVHSVKIFSPRYLEDRMSRGKKHMTTPYHDNRITWNSKRAVTRHIQTLLFLTICYNFFGFFFLYFCLEFIFVSIFTFLHHPRHLLINLHLILFTLILEQNVIVKFSFFKGNSLGLKTT